MWTGGRRLSSKSHSLRTAANDFRFRDAEQSPDDEKRRTQVWRPRGERRFPLEARWLPRSRGSWRYKAEDRDWHLVLRESWIPMPRQGFCRRLGRRQPRCRQLGSAKWPSQAQKISGTVGYEKGSSTATPAFLDLSPGNSKFRERARCVQTQAPRATNRKQNVRPPTLSQ